MAIRMCRCTTTEQRNQHGCPNPDISYEGAVLYTYERNGYDDSDFYAIVWDDERGTFQHIYYASTRAWTYHNHASIDATPEVIAKAEVKLAEFLAIRTIEKKKAEALEPLKGRKVRSITKKGKNVGIVGQVMWYGIDQYRTTKWITYFRIGIKVDGEDKLRYIAAESVDVIDPPEVDESAIWESAREMAKQHHWRIEF